jgi:hypothetical protein
MAKHLYGREQQAFVVLGVLESELRDTPIDKPQAILRKRAEAMGENKYQLAFAQTREQSWWELRWFDMYFFRHGADLFGIARGPGKNQPRTLWTEKELRDAGVAPHGTWNDNAEPTPDQPLPPAPP